MLSYQCIPSRIPTIALEFSIVFRITSALLELWVHFDEYAGLVVKRLANSTQSRKTYANYGISGVGWECPQGLAKCIPCDFGTCKCGRHGTTHIYGFYLPLYQTSFEYVPQALKYACILVVSVS